MPTELSDFEALRQTAFTFSVNDSNTKEKPGQASTSDPTTLTGTTHTTVSVTC